MRRTYPKIENMKFLICEQARPEMHNKLSIIGLYAGDHIIFHPEKIGQFPYTLQFLSFVFVIKDGVGNFSCKLELVNPKGEVIPVRELKPLELRADSTSGSIVGLSPVQFHNVGNFIARLHVDRKVYDFPFKVSAKKA